MVDALFDWVRQHETELLWTGVASLVLFVGTLLTLPWLIALLPADYFQRREQPWRSRWKHPVLVSLVVAAKNLLGLVFILLGLALLLLPGQGLLTILVGIMLVDFPGKRTLQRWLVTRPGVLHSINAIRRWRGRPPLELK